MTMRLRSLALFGLLATAALAALAAPAAAQDPDPTPLTDLCRDLTGARSGDCLTLVCSGQLTGPLGLKTDGCIGLACTFTQGLTQSCSASETLCRDVQPVYATVVRPGGVAVVDTLLGALQGNNLPAPALPVLRSVLVRAGFYCDPPEPGSGQPSSCQEVVTSDLARVGNRDFAYHDTGLGAIPLAQASDCAWLRSTTGGTLYAYQDGWDLNVVNAGSQSTDCQAQVRLWLAGSAGSHFENVRVVYC